MRVLMTTTSSSTNMRLLINGNGEASHLSIKYNDYETCYFGFFSLKGESY